MSIVLSFNREKAEREQARKRLAEKLIRDDPMFRGALDDIARCKDPHMRRSLAETLATFVFDAGFEAGKK